MPSSRGPQLPTPGTPYTTDPDDPLHVRDGKVWAPLARKWLLAKPEEYVRQRLVHELHTKYGYALDQMAQERRMARGRQSSRADIVIARDGDALIDNRDYVMVVETKADTVPLMPSDYWQGESYARTVQAEFLVMHNERETRCVRLLPGAPGERVEVERIPSCSDWADQSSLNAIRAATKTFTRDEFRKLLSDCHSILRDNHKMDPGAAFDEISKILFIKMGFERTGDRARFSRDYLRQYERVRRSRPEGLLQDLFDEAKGIYRADDLFGPEDGLKISLATFKRIVGELENFDLSATSDDVKGIAFESFLGQTFRGDLGQFFTPRPIVDFMVEMVDPSERDLVCDPASGTGGFLIKTFEYVRDKIVEEVELAKSKERRRLERTAGREQWTADKLAREIDKAFARLNVDLDPDAETGRMHRLSREQIYGADAESRAARVSKMNMIMHGDGHGGIYYHDGLLDVGGVLPDRFSVILTNPPFGSTVGQDQVVGATEQTRVTTDPARIREYTEQFGSAWVDSNARLMDAARARRPILSLFDIGMDPIGGDFSTATVRPARSTESLFLERCLRLLQPGGRLGIVLPEGVLNNPTLQWMRDYVEGRACLEAVVSVPHDVFASSKATVKTSLVFLRRFNSADEKRWASALRSGRADAARWTEDETAALLTQSERGVEDLGGAAGVEVFVATRRLRALEAEKRDATAVRAAARRAMSADERDRVKSLEKQLGNQAGRANANVRSVRQEASNISDLAARSIEAFVKLKALAVREMASRGALDELIANLPADVEFSDVDALAERETSAVEDIQSAGEELAMTRAREIFEYPVFVAEVEHAGITATGETGPGVANELPGVLAAYRAFRKASTVEYGLIVEEGD